jgi:hypothetical protein
MAQSMNRPIKKTTNPITPKKHAKLGAPEKNENIAIRISKKPVTSHIKPALSTRTELVIPLGGADDDLERIGTPQPGHDSALSEISLEHSLHFISAILCLCLVMIV